MAVIDVKSVYGTTIKQYYIGASTDSKPTDVQIGAKFLESDTNTTYIFGSDRTWVIDPEHQSLNKVWDTGLLDWTRMTQPGTGGSVTVDMTSTNSILFSIGSAQASTTSAVISLTSVQVSTVAVIASTNVQLASIDAELVSQVSAQISNTSVLASMVAIADATSTHVGAISTTLNNISTIGGNISNVLSGISNVLSGISNVLSGISARLSAISTVIGSTNTILTSMEAWQDPLAKFGIAFVDETSATAYYGFQGKTGDWYAMRISNGSYLYYYNSADLDTGWGSRNTLSFTSLAGMF